MRFFVALQVLLLLFLSPVTLQAQGTKTDSVQHQTDSARQEQDSNEAQFEPIFNGTDLADWDGDPRLWSVRDGVIHGETTAENKANGNTFLIWQGGSVADFELELEFRCNATNNSGIQYRSKHIREAVNNQWVVRGYQHEIRNEVAFPNTAGFIYDEGGSRGRICQVGEKLTWESDGKKSLDQSLIDQAEFKQLFKLDDWNKVRIVAISNHIQHYLNDRLILDFTENDPKYSLSEGVIALQLHGGAPMWAEFRNLQLKQIKPAVINKQPLAKPDGL
jgi:hypothetical protein